MALGLAIVDAGPATAQEPEPPAGEPAADTTVTPRVPAGPRPGPGLHQDTAATDTVAADTVLPPPPTLPALEPVSPEGWAHGVWEWGRPSLERLPHLSLLELLERVPGLVPVRADVANQPEAAAVLGSTAGAIRWILDGFELDPMVEPTFDPARISLLALESVRVERRVTGATVRLRTLRPVRPEPQSIIEAGTGDLDINLFRGVFLAPRVLGGPLGLGFERLSADGAIPGGTSNHTIGWLKWSWVHDRAGLQAELRRSDLDRAGVGSGLDGSRTDWVVRARSSLAGVTGEAYVGGTRLEESRGELTLREGAPHGGLRLRTAVEVPVPVEAGASIRLRDHPRLPGVTTEVDLHARPLALIGLGGTVAQSWWGEGVRSGSWTARAVAGPVLGVSAFGEITRGGPLLGDGPGLLFPSPDSVPLEVRRDGVRLGAELRLGSARIGAAYFRSSSDTVPGFGLATEPFGLGRPGGEADGVEVVVRSPTGWAPLTLEGWYVGVEGGRDWPYLPRHDWRAALVYHHLPLPSGNLEIFSRLEHVFRGAMAGPASTDPGATAAPEPVRVGAYRATNLELSIRVLTVRAFIRWQNIFHRIGQQDLEGFRRPGQNVLYGVKWRFQN